MAALHSVGVFVAVLFASASLITCDDTCVAYFDSSGNWHGSFDCNGILDGGDTCCGTLIDKYCCYASDTCAAYLDSSGNWHDSFECNGLLDGGDRCCGTLIDKYCCYNSGAADYYWRGWYTWTMYCLVFVLLLYMQ
ncbi:uncharacterized protein LOC102809796 [Saccoglossus kowalevskii]|uniref:Uncharacterized protein LOC102809796 n=1 Tax=Saccoglossus kowalevskii TaxID=10224 RepID=A0ABM0N088_SACKO|nr:PREDICTED: uncharacterized protein LOC102809796 [Saccoglossus kowalevskii]